MCELKIAQLKRASTLSKIRALAEKNEIPDEIPRFASVQSNSIA